MINPVSWAEGNSWHLSLCLLCLMATLQLTKRIMVNSDVSRAWEVLLWRKSMPRTSVRLVTKRRKKYKRKAKRCITSTMRWVTSTGPMQITPGIKCHSITTRMDTKPCSIRRRYNHKTAEAIDKKWTATSLIDHQEPRQVLQGILEMMSSKSRSQPSHQVLTMVTRSSIHLSISQQHTNFQINRGLTKMSSLVWRHLRGIANRVWRLIRLQTNFCVDRITTTFRAFLIVLSRSVASLHLKGLTKEK